MHHGLNPLGIESEHVEDGRKDSERKVEAESKRKDLRAVLVLQSNFVRYHMNTSGLRRLE